MPWAAWRNQDPLIVAGIDPGTRCMGFGVVAREGTELKAVDHGSFRPPKKASRGERLAFLHQQVGRLLDHHHPDVLALEEAFFQHNVQSALRLGEARGAVMIAAAERQLVTVEYPTAVAKKSVTGHGGASKEMVRDLVTRELGLDAPPRAPRCHRCPGAGAVPVARPAPGLPPALKISQAESSPRR